MYIFWRSAARPSRRLGSGCQKQNRQRYKIRLPGIVEHFAYPSAKFYRVKKYEFFIRFSTSVVFDARNAATYRKSKTCTRSVGVCMESDISPLPSPEGINKCEIRPPVSTPVALVQKGIGQLKSKTNSGGAHDGSIPNLM